MTVGHERALTTKDVRARELLLNVKKIDIGGEAI